MPSGGIIRTTCRSCSKPLSKSAIERGSRTGLCAGCWHASIRKPRICIQCGAGLAKCKAKRCQPCNNRFLALDLAREERRIRLSLEARLDPAVRARHNAANARAAARKLAWCPAEHRTDYHRLVKRISAAKAKAIILGRMSPFERQLSKVRDGAAVVAKLVLRPIGHEFTLGGVSAGMGL